MDLLRRGRRAEPSIARQVLLTQLLVVLVLVGVSAALAAYDARADARDRASKVTLTVARSVADAPGLPATLAGSEPSRTLEPYVERLRRATGTDFITVMTPDRVRLTHPDPSLIGRRFIGDVGDALDGRAFRQTHAGTLGPSVRWVVPVESQGRVVGLVAVGITVSRIDSGLRSDLLLIAVAAVPVVGVGLLGSWWVTRRLRRRTHGLGEREITRMYEFYRAVLHAVREGLVLLDDRGTVQLVNDEARTLLELPADVVGSDVRRLGLPPALVAAALGRTAESDDLYLVGEHLLVVSSAPAQWDGREVGVVLTLRDHTELQSVTGELDVARGLTQALRAQTHEAANRLHTVVSLVEMGRADEAVDLATEELQVAQVLTDQVVGGVGDPVLAAVLLGKSAEAAERGTTLSVEGGASVADLSARDLVTVLGNLVDNALDAVAERPDGTDRRVRVRLTPDADGLEVAVGDSGPGFTDAEAARALEQGWSTKAGSAVGGRGVGLALVRRTARRHGGDVRIGRSDLGGAEVAVHLRRGA
ncbi:histidine kinase [Marmoricola endophyticus]|uniref:histidine kinase n=1 Tax=Marmoricola endophyticus TaxID=2040280 RepID=A0A917F2I3_9ACTN|nr:sensor histidine kinase [Marmoricola endophyticus]GGF36557.1 histidine kinase [Marmoricola endophyticus]